MRAVVFEGPNDLKLKDAVMPALADGEALIKVLYSGICGSDIHLLQGHHPTATFPRIPGHEFVGRLVEIQGHGAEQFHIGELVVAQEIEACGHCDACAKGQDNVCEELKVIGVHVNGSFAEYVKVPIGKMYAYPEGMDLELAALTEPLAVAVHDVRRSGLRVGETAFILGGGPIGLLIAMVARKAGARMVAIAEVNDYRRNFAKEMGFTVLNPADGDYAEQLKGLTDGHGFDVSFEVAGFPDALNICIEHTKASGTVMVVAMTSAPYPINTGPIFFKELDVKGVRIHSQYSFAGAIDIIKSGAMNDELKKLVSKVFPMDEADKAFDFAIQSKEAFKVLVQVSEG